MTMRKKRRWLWWTGGVIAFMLAIGFMGWNAAVYYFLDSMLQEPHGERIIVASGENQFDRNGQSEARDQASDERKGTAESQSSVGSQDAAGGQSSEKGDNSVGGSSGSGDAKAPAGDSSDKAQSGDSSQVVTKPATLPASESEKYDGNISPEKAKEVQESVTFREKALLTQVLLKKFSTEELKLFTKMASGGLNLSEKKEVKEVFLQKLTEKEYDELIAIAAKYGLSQGKSFAESQKEEQSSGKP